MKKIKILISEVIFVFKWEFVYKNMKFCLEKYRFFLKFADKFRNELDYIYERAAKKLTYG